MAKKPKGVLAPPPTREGAAQRMIDRLEAQRAKKGTYDACPRLAHIAKVVQTRATDLLHQPDNPPGVEYRAQDAVSWATDAIHQAQNGSCSTARVYLKAALKYYRRARVKAGG